MKKPDEIALYAFMRFPSVPNVVATDEAADALGISRQRAHYLVDKWRDKNYCDGPCTSYVYFYTNAPSALLPWGVVA